MADTVLSVGIAEAEAPSPTYLQRLATHSLIEGARSADWWSKQKADTQFRFAKTIRAGLAQNLTPAEMARQVRDQMGITTRAATALVRTSVMQVAADARRETFQRNSDIIAGLRHVSHFDNRTSDVCLSYGSDSDDGGGAQYDLDYNPINGTKLPYDGGVPRHWNCRSVEVAITRDWEDLGMEKPEGYPEFLPPQSGEDWMREQAQEVQDELLGPGRAELWRQGKVKLVDLLDQQGNALSVAELEKKYAIEAAVENLPVVYAGPVQEFTDDTGRPPFTLSKDGLTKVYELRESKHDLVRPAGYDMWGASHGGSTAISTWASRVMGLPEYLENAEPGYMEYWKNPAERLARFFLQAISDDKLGSEEPLYHGFQNVRNVEWKVGDTVRLPITATSGDLSHSAGYGYRLDPKDQVGAPTVFAFPEGTPMAGYARWTKGAQREFGDMWEEALVAGEYRVAGVGSYDPQYPMNPFKTTVVSLTPLRVFDPQAGQWKSR